MKQQTLNKTHSTLDVESIRKDFPILREKVHGEQLVYFDNAATSQKPLSVIKRIEDYYEHENSNVHRGVHHLSQKATDDFEQTRLLIQHFINAEHSYEIIFTKGTTEGINLVANSFGRKYVKEGDEILITHMEHHSNIVPWQILCEHTGAVLKVVPINDQGELDMEAFHQMLSDKTRLVSVVYISNSLGTINPVKEIIDAAHQKDIPVLVDGAQVIPHQAIDVQALGCDFFVCSGHKIFSPTGIGFLYGKEKWLEEMPPFMGGGDMIKVVRFEKTTYNELPHKFEAGTPHIEGVIGLGAGIEYLQGIGYEAISQYEGELLQYATERLQEIPEIRLIGTAKEKASVVSFLIGDIHPYDAGTIIDRLGIAIRTGHHCTQPVMERFGIPGTMRASFAFYNTKEEIDKLIEAIQKVRQMFGKA